MTCMPLARAYLQSFIQLTSGTPDVRGPNVIRQFDVCTCERTASIYSRPSKTTFERNYSGVRYWCTPQFQKHPLCCIAPYSCMHHSITLDMMGSQLEKLPHQQCASVVHSGTTEHPKGYLSMRLQGQDLDTEDIQSMVTGRSRISHKDESVNFAVHPENLWSEKSQILSLCKSQILHEWQIQFMKCACDTR